MNVVNFLTPSTMETVGSMSSYVQTFIYLIDQKDTAIKPLEDYYKGKDNIEYLEVDFGEFDADYKVLKDLMGKGNCQNVIYMQGNMVITEDWGEELGEIVKQGLNDKMALYSSSIYTISNWTESSLLNPKEQKLTEIMTADLQSLP